MYVCEGSNKSVCLYFDIVSNKYLYHCFYDCIHTRTHTRTYTHTHTHTHTYTHTYTYIYTKLNISIYYYNILTTNLPYNFIE